MDEIVRVLRSMKIGKAAGYDRVSVQIWKSGDAVVLSLLCLIFYIRWRHGRVPYDWCKTDVRVN